MNKKYNRRKKKRGLRKKRRIKHIGIGLSIMTLLIVWSIFNIGAGAKDIKQKEKSNNIYAQNIMNSQHEENKKEKESKQNRDNKGKNNDGQAGYIYDWQILLVNEDNKVPDEYSFELSNIDNIRKFDSRALEYLIQLIKDCEEETGGSIWAQSTYRDRNTQEELYNKEIKQYMDEGAPREEAERLAAMSVAKPGRSEHEIGLAVDFNYVDLEFQNSAAFRWLLKNSNKYGFVLRYPKEKEHITKISYEPWHFRYVGKEHAKVIKAKEFCLEEYIDYLKKQGEN